MSILVFDYSTISISQFLFEVRPDKHRFVVHFWNRERDALRVPANCVLGAAGRRRVGRRTHNKSAGSTGRNKMFNFLCANFYFFFLLFFFPFTTAEEKSSSPSKAFTLVSVLTTSASLTCCCSSVCRGVCSRPGEFEPISSFNGCSDCNVCTAVEPPLFFSFCSNFFLFRFTFNLTESALFFDATILRAVASLLSSMDGEAAAGESEGVLVSLIRTEIGSSSPYLMMKEREGKSMKHARQSKRFLLRPIKWSTPINKVLELERFAQLVEVVFPSMSAVQWSGGSASTLSYESL